MSRPSDFAGKGFDMNRCITCSKIVTRLKAQNNLEYDSRRYLVCCPMCEKEFLRDPEYYINIAESVLGVYAINAHTPVVVESQSGDKVSEDIPEYTRMLRNMKESFDNIEKSYIDLNRHFSRISKSGGLEGLRKALKNHRQMMDSIKEQLRIHSGVCKFVLSVAESTRHAGIT